jgi:hypothetical protein
LSISKGQKFKGKGFMEQQSIYKFLFRSEFKTLNEALQIKTNIAAQASENSDELVKSLSTASSGLVVCALKEKNDLIELATFIKICKKNSKICPNKILVVNFSGDKQFEKAILRLGISDIVEPTVNAKSLRFKIDFLMRSLSAIAKQQTPMGASSQSVNREEVKSSERKISDHLPTWSAPLECEDDIWILRNETDCKKVLTRWLVKFMGPSPYVAQWVDSGTPGIWRFDFKDDNRVFIFGQGAWFFRGDQKPEFIWSENNWLFTGSNFELLYKEGETIHQRLKLQDRSLSICKNSDFAKTKIQKIIESFNKELVFRNDQQDSGGDESIENETDLYKKLSGKGKTETLDYDPLSGKGKTSNITIDPLSGKAKTAQLGGAPLSMDLNPGDNDLSSDPLSQKATKNSGPSFWDEETKGKGGGDLGGFMDGPAPDAVNEGQELGLDSKGKVSTFYKKHNEAEQYEAKDDLGHSIKKDGVSGNLAGKIDPKFRDKDQGGDLDGANSTDRLKSHLKNPELSKEDKEKEAKTPSAYAGKSKTDKLDDHLSSPEIEKKQKNSQDKNEPEKNEPAAKASLPQGLKKRDDGGRLSDDETKSAPSAGPDKKENQKSVAQASGELKAEELPDNVLPFDKNTKLELDDELPKDLEEAIQSAKVISYLVQDLVKVECKLDDYFDCNIIFKSTQVGLLVDRPVKLNLNFNYMSKDTILKLDGKVTSLESDDEGVQFITVEISPDYDAVFGSFMRLYQSRQKNINVFMKAAKGY